MAPSWLGLADHVADLVDETLLASGADRGSGLLPDALRYAAWLYLDRGDWDRAYEAATEGAALAQAAGQSTALCDCLTALAWIDAARGNETECVDSATRAQDLASRHGLVWLAVWAERALALQEVGAGRFDHAVRSLTQIQTRLNEGGIQEPWSSPAPDLVEAWLRLGRPDRAAAAGAPFLELAGPSGDPLTIALQQHCLGLTAVAGWTDHFRAALDAHDSAGNAFQRARTLLCFGERLRRDRRGIEARDPLREASTIFIRLDARNWVARTHGELRATGDRGRTYSPTVTGGALTPQERRIALEVARGESNKAVASTLYLSPKTVEFHLGRVFRKLGVASRTELSRALSDHRCAAPSSGSGD